MDKKFPLHMKKIERILLKQKEMLILNFIKLGRNNGVMPQFFSHNFLNQINVTFEGNLVFERGICLPRIILIESA
jgi:phosphopantetheinyl transferase